MTRRFPTVRAGLLALSLLTACDCDDRLRKMVSAPGDRKMRDTAESAGPAEQEPNEDPTRATAFEIGKELRPIKGVISAPEDVDWFAFSVAGEEEAFEVTVEPDAGLDVSLHVDVKGSAPLVYDLGRRGDPERIPVLEVAAAPQKFAVRSEADSSGSYRITLKRHLGAAGLEGEPNDDASVATRFEIPGELQGFYDRPDDRDVYELVGERDVPFVLEIGPAPGVRQIARVFDDESLREPVLTVQVTPEGPFRIPSFGLPTSGSRWLVLTPLGQPPSDKPYRLRVTPHPEVEVALELEPNDVKPATLEFSEPEADGARVARVVGYLHSADDVDRFEIVPPRVTPKPKTAPERGADTEPDPLARYRGKEGPRIPVLATVEWTNKASSLGMRWLAEGGEVEFRQSSPDLEVTACGLDLDAGAATVEVRSAQLAEAPRVGEPQYRLTVRETSSSSGWEAEPNNDFGKADVLDGVRRGTFAAHEDVDTFVFAVHGGEEGEEAAAVPVQVKALAKRADLVLRVLDDGGGVVANVDSGVIGSAETLRVDLPPGLYFAELRFKDGELCAPYEIEVTGAGAR